MNLTKLIISGVFAATLAQVGTAQEPSARLINDAENHEFLLIIGPTALPVPHKAMQGDSTTAYEFQSAHAPVFPPIATVEIPESVYLTGFSYEVVDGTGETIPLETLHHLNLINPDDRELFLPISQRILAVGKETGAQSMPWFVLGYPMPAGTPMVVAAMLHNPTGVAYDGVEIRVHLTYVKAGRPWPLFSVYPFQLDVAFPAGDKSVDLLPGKSEFSYDASPVMEGRVMVIGGHLHEYATSLRFEDVTENRVIWEGRPVYQNGVLETVTVGRLYRTLGEKIYPNHVYRVTVSYDNPTADTLHEGGMGVVAGVFMPSGGRMWPRADQTHELYILDRKHYMRDVRGRFELIQKMVATGEQPPETGGDHSH